MPQFHFSHPIEVRYGDLDPQGHLNNARYLTYFEQARIHYMRHLGLWQGGSFMDVGIILLNAQVTFLRPVLFGQPLRVGVAITKIGNKSLQMVYQLVDAAGQVYSEGSTVLVAYDYHTSQSMPVPNAWRTRIAEFEHFPPTSDSEN